MQYISLQCKERVSFLANSFQSVSIRCHHLKPWCYSKSNETQHHTQPKTKYSNWFNLLAIHACCVSSKNWKASI